MKHKSNLGKLSKSTRTHKKCLQKKSLSLNTLKEVDSALTSICSIIEEMGKLLNRYDKR